MENSSLLIYDLFNTSLPIDYTLQGDRWIQYLFEALQEDIPGANGNGVGGTGPIPELPYHHWDFTVSVNPNINANPMPTLRIVPVGKDSSKGVYLFLSSRQPVAQKDIDLWKKCIEKARHRLNDENPMFPWIAVFAYEHNPQLKVLVLREKTKIGSLIFKSGGKQIAIYEKGNPPGFSNFLITASWPIIIEGEAKGYNWMVASQEAGQQLHVAAALLSLAWGITFKLIQSPQQIKPDDLKIPDTNIPVQSTSHFPKQPKAYKRIPKWIIEVFSKINDETTLKHALNAYYQGLTMEQDHPSFALIAFVATIESVGKTIIGENCACCGKKNGANQKFRAGLSSVITNKNEVNRLGDIYGARSDTAHEGILHGNETSLGAINLPSIFNLTSAELFAYTDLREIKMAARKCLIKATKKIK